MAASRFYSSAAGMMSLSGAITNVATTMVVSAVTGLPASTPFTLIVEPGLVSEEIVECTGVGGTTLTITRGIDGSSAQTHASGVEVRHGFSARDFQDSRNHEANITTAHGAGSGVASVTTDATGYATVTHGLAFTPGKVFIQGNQPSVANNIWGVDTLGATTFRVRAITGAGAAAVGTFTFFLFARA